MTRTVVTTRERRRAAQLTGAAGVVLLGYGVLFVHNIPAIVIGGILLLLAGWVASRS
jgi:hypothetical protein